MDTAATVVVEQAGRTHLQTRDRPHTGTPRRADIEESGQDQRGDG